MKKIQLNIEKNFIILTSLKKFIQTFVFFLKKEVHPNMFYTVLVF